MQIGFVGLGKMGMNMVTRLLGGGHQVVAFDTDPKKRGAVKELGAVPKTSIISMVAVANLQYGWTFFVPSITKAMGATTALVTVTFTIFVLVETWLVPFEGYLVDKFGPRKLVLVGSVFAAAGWIGAGLVSDLTSLYLVYALARPERF